jgi:hypothetical protein
MKVKIPKKNKDKYRRLKRESTENLLQATPSGMTEDEHRRFIFMLILNESEQYRDEQ